MENILPTVSEVKLIPNSLLVAECDPPTKKCSPNSSSSSEVEEHEEIVDIENVTVKFHLNGNQTIAQVYPNCMTLDEVKTDIGRRFEIEPKFLILKQGNQILSDSCAIFETDFDEFGIHEYMLELKNTGKSTKTNQQYNDAEQELNEPKLDLNIYYRYLKYSFKHFSFLNNIVSFYSFRFLFFVD